MMRRTLIAAAAFMGLAVAGTVATATPASAGYACGPWNGWCSWYGYKNYGWNGYGYRHWGYHNYRHWGGDWDRGHGRKAYRGGGNKKHANKRSNRRHWR